MIHLVDTLKAAINAAYEYEITPVITRPEPQFGDYTTNVALQLAKPLGQNPRAIAEKIAEDLASSGQFRSIEVAGPGFLNIRLNDEALLQLTSRSLPRSRSGETVVIETNNPNPFKAMHIGHAYNSVVADTVANLFAVSGATVHRVSYHGDIGAHVGKSMWAWLRFADGDIQKLSDVSESERNMFMNRMYAEGSTAAKEDQIAKEEIAMLAKQSYTREDPHYAAVYDMVKDWSFAQLERDLMRLGNVPIERRYLESQADPVGVATVKANVPAVFQESDGALMFEGSKHGSFDNVFVGSNGLGLYAARDLGLIQLKARDYPQMDTCVTVTGGEQAAYFKGVIAAAELALPQIRGKMKNFSTGLVKLSTGKMSSRTGDVVTIEWVFDEFGKAISARGGEPGDEIIAGALRYQFLKVKIGGDVVFDVNEAVSLTGNTGSYLQYAHARARRIIEKAGADWQMPAAIYTEDRALVRKLGEYHEIIELASRTLEPHHICSYLFELAQEFNRYYEQHQVIGTTHEMHRVGLVGLYAKTLKSGLAVLGIHAPETM